MIRLEPAPDRLAPVHRFGLLTLVDLARLVPLVEPRDDVPTLTVVDGPADPDALARPDQWSWPRWGTGLAVPSGLLELTVEIVSVAAEQRSDLSDRHGRVPSAVNYLVRHGLDRTPIVNRLAGSLSARVAEIAPSAPLFVPPWPERRRWAVAMSHDVDVVAGWPVFSAARMAELFGRGRGGQASEVLRAAARSVGRDPVGAGVERILEVEHHAGVTATWFFLAGRPSWSSWRRGDVTYGIERAAPLVRGIVAAGHRIGLHGSLRTTDEPARFAAERRLLMSVAGQPVEGVRQHFLRVRPGATHRDMAAAGFTYDSTLGFPDRNGFRTGVADVLPFWDHRDGRALGLDEVPLVWMDRTASKYQGVEDVDRWIDEALALAETCRGVGGVWTGLWHPNLTPELGFPGAPAGFERLVRQLVVNQPWLASLDEIVAWRRFRRTLFARSLTADGVPVLDGPLPRPLILEDGQGRPRVELS